MKDSANVAHVKIAPKRYAVRKRFREILETIVGRLFPAMPQLVPVRVRGRRLQR